MHILRLYFSSKQEIVSIRVVQYFSTPMFIVRFQILDYEYRFLYLHCILRVANYLSLLVLIGYDV